MSKGLSKLVDDMQSMLSHVNTHEDLRDVVQLAIDYGKPVKYDNIALYAASAILLTLISAIKFIYPYSNLLFIVLIIVSLIPAIIGLSRKSALNDLEKQIFTMDAYLDNNLMSAEAPDFHELDRRYSEFIRGNHSRNMEYYVKGSAKKDEYKLDYSVYNFHYVDKHIRTDSKGNEKVSYAHYYRFGVILENFTAHNIQIIQSDIDARHSIKWTTSSIKFNKLFQVYAADEMEAAKFFKPVVILRFEEFSNEFPEINVEIDNNSCLCISFEGHNLLMLDEKFSLEDPRAFLESIKGKTAFPMLDQVLDFLYTLMIKTDNNFRSS